MNNTATHRGVQTSLSDPDFKSFAYIPRTGLTTSYGALFWIFREIFILFSTLTGRLYVPITSAQVLRFFHVVHVLICWLPSWQVWGDMWLWLPSVLPWWFVRPSTFSHTHTPKPCCRSSSYPCWAIGISYVFWMMIFYQIQTCNYFLPFGNCFFNLSIVDFSTWDSLLFLTTWWLWVSIFSHSDSDSSVIVPKSKVEIALCFLAWLWRLLIRKSQTLWDSRGKELDSTYL